MHEAILILGSNIQPLKNLQNALALLREIVQVQTVSTTYETEPIGSSGPNFLNTAVRIQTSQDYDVLKWQTLRRIEAELGRVRTEDKNAPRTIDLDIIVFDGFVTDPILWERAFVAIPVAELVPNLKNPQTGADLAQTVADLKEKSYAVPRKDFSDLIH